MSYMITIVNFGQLLADLIEMNFLAPLQFWEPSAQQKYWEFLRVFPNAMESIFISTTFPGFPVI
jgi:hypothetical protein